MTKEEFETLARKMCDKPGLFIRFLHHDDKTIELQLMKEYRLVEAQLLHPEYLHVSIARMHIENAIEELNIRTDRLEQWLKDELKIIYGK